MYPALQEQLTAWLITLHSASTPQEPGHGSRHLLLIQDKLFGQSGLITHSGLQFGGDPTYPVRQVQEGFGPFALHCEFGPQGEGTQGSLSSSTANTGAKNKNKMVKMIFV